MDLATDIRSGSSKVEEYYFREKAIFISLSCVFAGIFVSSFIFLPPIFSIFLLLVSLSIICAEKVWHKELGKEVLFLIIGIIAFALGGLRYDIKDFHMPDPRFESSVGQEMEMRGIVVSEPEERDSYTRLVINTCGHSVSTCEKVLVNADMFTPVRYGDEVRVQGELRKPEVVDDGEGRPFDYPQYLAKDDIYYTMSFADLEVLTGGHGSVLRRGLLALKAGFIERIRENFSEPQASLLAGLIVAGRDAMPESIVEEFRRAGVVHIVVLSGYNITIIAEFMRKILEKILLLSRIGARPALAAGGSILGILLFVLMTGAQATVVRAALMVVAVIAAKLFGRGYSAPRALIAAAFIMVSFNPKILVFDPSFQLSFLATLALIYVVPIADGYLKWLPDKWGARTMIATTLSTQVVVLPYLMYSMGQVSLVSLPANILILLIIPVTMLTGFAAVVSSFLLPATLSLILAFPAYLLLSWILGVSHVLGNLPLASTAVPAFPVWGVVFAYVTMIILVWYILKKPRQMV